MKFKFFVFCFFVNLSVFSQQKFPQGYFIMPIDPGQITSLAGCFGDIRINHFHAGLDIRTGGVEGKNVYAAAEGYVSRIKIMNGGYGNCLYITHPNGLTTVYAHLKTFNDEIQSYLLLNQYKQHTWEIDLMLKPDQIKISQGDLIALSGNTGGSAGPHLHFEIRDAQENVLDPSQFGFSELIDRIPPVIEQVTLKCMSVDARINGNFGSYVFPVVRNKKGFYQLTKKVSASGLIGIELKTYDRADKSPFRQGVREIDIRVNQKPTFNFALDKMAFSNRLDMNWRVDYEKMLKNGQKIYKCYVENGTTFDFYKTNETAGKFEIMDPSNQVEITVNDAFQNQTFLSFDIEKDETVHPNFSVFRYGTNVQDHFLKIECNDPEREIKNIKLMKNGVPKYLLPGDSASIKKLFVFDLDHGIPDQIIINDNAIAMPINVALSNKKPKVQFPNFTADFTNALFDKHYVNFESKENELILHEDIIPLKNSATIVWDQGHYVSDTAKCKVYQTKGKRKFVGGEWNGTKVKFSIKEFGTYQLMYDFDPPVIMARVINSNRIEFIINDILSGIKTINCWVNNEWVVMDFEYKTGLIWAEKLDNSVPFQGIVHLEITDKCNNKQVYETTLPSL